jgi:hypothetical protein
MNQMTHCIDHCTNCHKSCVSTLTHCLSMGEAHSVPEHVCAMLDCAAACAIAADFMMRGSPQHALLCATCADVCARCAQSCEAVNDGPIMQRCIDECRACEEACRMMGRAKAA